MKITQYKPEKWNEQSIHFGYTNFERAYAKNSYDCVLKLNSKSILDIGCCKGDYIRSWRDAGYKGNYTGIDVTPNFIEEAKKRMPNEEFLVANLYEYNSEKRYDLVICQNVIMHLPEIKIAMEKIFKFSSNYVFFSSYSTKEKTTSSHDNDFLNYHYNTNELLENVPAGFILLEEYYFENAYCGIAISQFLMKINELTE